MAKMKPRSRIDCLRRRKVWRNAAAVGAVGVDVQGRRAVDRRVLVADYGHRYLHAIPVRLPVPGWLRTAMRHSRSGISCTFRCSSSAVNRCGSRSRSMAWSLMCISVAGCSRRTRGRHQCRRCRPPPGTPRGSKSPFTIDDAHLVQSVDPLIYGNVVLRHVEPLDVQGVRSL